MKKSTQIILLIVALFILVFSGGFYMKEQQRKEELKRNREYEVSLVKALKNSYENIEEIKSHILFQLKFLEIGIVL